MSDKEVWFEYFREGHRTKAIPVHWKGWVILLGLSFAPGCGTVALILCGARTGWVMAYAFVSMILVFTALIVLIRKRGRRRGR